MKTILCIGSVTTDVIVTPADTVPEPGTLRAVEGVTTHVGGCAANAAIDLAKLGVPVLLSCKVGMDNYGEYIKKTASAYGVDITGIVEDGSVSTTVSIVCVHSDGERSFLYQPGSAAAFTESNISDDLLNKCDIVFVAGAMLLTDFDGEPCARLLQRAKKLGKYTVMDTAWDFEDLWLSKIAAAIPFVDLFMPSYEEAVKLSGEKEVCRIADFFLNMGAKNVIIKIGKDGAYVCEHSGERYTLPTYAQIKPVDTTGAGDAFCSGVLCGLAQDWNYRESARLGNAVGTHCIMSIGASTGIRPLPEILQFMDENRESL